MRSRRNTQTCPAIAAPFLSPAGDVFVVVARLDLELTFVEKPVSREQRRSRLGDGEALEIVISLSLSSIQSPSTSSSATASDDDRHGGERRLNFDGQQCHKSSINHGWVTAKLWRSWYLRLNLCPHHLRHRLLAATAMVERGDRTSTTDSVVISHVKTTLGPTTTVLVLQRSWNWFGIFQFGARVLWFGV